MLLFIHEAAIGKIAGEQILKAAHAGPDRGASRKPHYSGVPEIIIVKQKAGLLLSAAFCLSYRQHLMCQLHLIAFYVAVVVQTVPDAAALLL